VIDWVTSLFDWVPDGTADWGYFVLLMVALIVGWLVNILGLPGLWVMVLAHLAYGWMTTWETHVGLSSVIVLFLMATIAELVEFAAGAAGSAQAGGTKRGMLGAIVGGLVGGIVGSILIPIPIVGTIIGAVGGSFCGAAVVERMINNDTQKALRVGIGAAKGRFAGIIIKSTIGAMMIVISLAAACPMFTQTQSTNAPTTVPATVPATQPTTQAVL
jgi:uncharacterized protein